MLRKVIMLGMLGLAAPAAADTGELSFSSSGTTAFQLYIPPIAASLRAAATGAAGIWTVKGRDGGLMIGLNREGDGFGSVTLFSRTTVGVELSWGAPGENSSAHAVTDIGGLNRTTYAVPEGTSPVRTFLVSGI